METKIFEPISFCGGVRLAIKKAIEISELNKNKKIYLLGKIVNNPLVINDLEKYNIQTLDVNPFEYAETIEKLENNSIVIFSAHGHDKKLEKICKFKNIEFIDTTCVKVKDNMNIVEEKLHDGFDIIIAGKYLHPETYAFNAISDKVHCFDSIKKEIPLIKNARIALIFQSTISIQDEHYARNILSEKYPNIELIDTTCRMVRYRTDLLLNTPEEYKNIIILGSTYSSNTTSMKTEAIEKFKTTKHIIQVNSLDELKDHLNELDKKEKVAIYSGTSTPMQLIEEINNFLINY